MGELLDRPDRRGLRHYRPNPATLGGHSTGHQGSDPGVHGRDVQAGNASLALGRGEERDPNVGLREE